MPSAPTTSVEASTPLTVRQSCGEPRHANLAWRRFGLAGILCVPGADAVAGADPHAIRLTSGRQSFVWRTNRSANDSKPPGRKGLQSRPSVCSLIRVQWSSVTVQWEKGSGLHAHYTHSQCWPGCNGKTKTWEARAHTRTHLKTVIIGVFGAGPGVLSPRAA